MQPHNPEAPLTAKDASDVTETSTLIQYDIACRALAQARSVDEVKDIKDKAEAIRIYAKQMKNKDLEINAAEIRIRAERRWGQLYKDEQKSGTVLGHGGSRRGDDFKVTLNDLESGPLTLESLGVSKNESSRAQKLADVPEETFESIMGEWRERVNQENERVTVNLLKENARREKDERLDSQQTASIHYLHRHGAYIQDFDAIANRVQSGLQEPYGCIYVDPPWAYQNQGTRASTNNHYETMSVDDLIKFPVGDVAADCSHLHLWTTNAFLFECPRLFAAWGFEFKSCFVWVKPQMGIGNYWRNAHELLLLGVRGGQTALDRSLRSWAESSRKEHSAKPKIVREFVEKLSPGPYLELFGREFVDGWTVFGNECRNQTHMELLRGNIVDEIRL